MNRFVISFVLRYLGIIQEVSVRITYVQRPPLNVCADVPRLVNPFLAERNVPLLSIGPVHFRVNGC